MGHPQSLSAKLELHIAAKATPACRISHEIPSTMQVSTHAFPDKANSDYEQADKQRVPKYTLRKAPP
jgi:hypothetical protein